MAHVHASFFRSPLPLKPVALAAALTVASLSVVHGQELLAQAGGFGPKADKSGIELQRKAKNGELEKKEVELTHSLQAEDVIFVTESLF